jgi:hypothetical protein
LSAILLQRHTYPLNIILVCGNSGHMIYFHSTSGFCGKSLQKKWECGKKMLLKPFRSGGKQIDLTSHVK